MMKKVRETLSLGVVVPDKFYELARKNEEMYPSSAPYSVELEYDVPFNYIDITEKYDERQNPNIRKTKIKARDLETEISKLHQNLVTLI